MKGIEHGNWVRADGYGGLEKGKWYQVAKVEPGVRGDDCVYLVGKEAQGFHYDHRFDAVSLMKPPEGDDPHPAQPVADRNTLTLTLGILTLKLDMSQPLAGDIARAVIAVAEKNGASNGV